MREFAALEWRKNRATLAGFSLLFLASLPLAAAAALRARLPAGTGLEAALLFWVVMGLPLSALFIGAGSGSAQRGTLADEAEAPLPVSPRARALGALAAAAAQLLAFAALVLGAASLSPAVREAVATGKAWAIGSPFLRPMIVVSGFATSYSLLASFCAAYAVGNGILGGVAGFLLATPLAGGLIFAQGLELLYGPRAQFGFATGLVIAAAFAGLISALRGLPPWLTRRAWPGWPRAVAIALSAALGHLALRAASNELGRRLLHGMSFPRVDWRGGGVYNEGRLDALWQAVPGFAWENVRRAAYAGALVSDIRGRVMRLDADGRVTELVPPLAIERPRDIEKVEPFIRLESATVDREGNWWLLREAWERGAGRPSLELWTGREGPLRLAARAPHKYGTALIWRGPELFVGRVWGDEDGKSETLAKVLPDGRLGPWLGGRLEPERYPKAWHAAGLVAAGSGRRAWVPGRRWSLPGKILGGGAWRRWKERVYAPGLRLGGALVFPFAIALDGGLATALCGSDGVRVVWKGFGAEQLRLMPDGSAMDGGLGQPWLLIAPDGAALPPFALTPSRELVRSLSRSRREAAKRRGETDVPKHEEEFLHTDGRSVWLLAERRVLIKARAADGSVEEHETLPDNQRFWRSASAPYRVVRDGLFWQTSRRIHFYGWDGARRSFSVLP